MSRKYVISLWMVCCLVFTASAQSVYTLEKCQSLALQNNAKMKNNQLNLEAATQSKKEAFTNYFPSVSATGMGFKSQTPLMEMATPEGVMGMMKDGMAGGVMATQPIFVGGKIITGNKMAKLGLEMTQYQTELSEDEVILKTEEYYWQIVSLNEKLKTISMVESQLQNIRKDVEISHQAGLIGLNDVLKVKLKQNELQAARFQIENGFQLSKMALCQHIGIPLDSASYFNVETPEFGDIASPAIYYVDHSSALPLRSESKLLEKNVELNKLQTKMKRGDYLPTAAIGGGYMYDNLMGSDRTYGMIYATVSVPISGWWGGSHALKKQKIQERIAENNRQEGEELLMLQMQQVRNELDESYKQVQIRKLSVEEATENRRLNNDYYKAGTVSLTDLLDAETLLQQSLDGYTDACTVYQIKLKKYFQVTGR